MVFHFIVRCAVKSIPKIPQVSPSIPEIPKVLIFILCFWPVQGLRGVGSPGGSEESSYWASQIQKYVFTIQTSGFYLELIDAECFALQHDRELAIAVDQPGEPLFFQRSLVHWKLSAGVENLVVPELDFSDKKIWCLVSCNATYDPNVNLRNHWMPAFHKGTIPSDVYFALTVEKQSKVRGQIRATKNRLRELEEQWERDVEGPIELRASLSDDHMAMASLISELRLEVSRPLSLMLLGSVGLGSDGSSLFFNVFQ